MTTTTIITERLGALFTERFHIEVPSADTDLLETGILDSFQFVELLFQLEQHFGLRVSIDDIDLEDLRTLERIARLVEANGAAATSPLPAPASGAAN
ncbi:MAG TPA: phosphopantetheine-binding protein [Burkholderiales bacterium]|nr:phosphopantetheine-binding protein [Burkholderiales bacterium]